MKFPRLRPKGEEAGGQGSMAYGQWTLSHIITSMVIGHNDISPRTMVNGHYEIL